MKFNLRSLSTKKSNRGFTLVELVVSLLIIAIVITSIFAFFLFQNKTYTRSVDRSQLQSELRLISDYITNKLRNASKVSLTESTLSNKFYLSGKSLFLNDMLLSETVDSIGFAISPAGEKFSVDFTLAGSRKNNVNFSLISNVLLNNADISGDISTINPAIYFDDVEPIIPEGSIDPPEEPDPDITPPPAPSIDPNIDITFQPKLQYIKKNFEQTFSIVSIKDDDTLVTIGDPKYSISFSYSSNDPSYTWSYVDNTISTITLIPPNKNGIGLSITYKVTNNETGHYNTFTDDFISSTSTVIEA